MNNFKDKQFIFFDLDGTLTDSQEGIYNAVIYSLKDYNVPLPTLGDLKQFIGPPIREVYKNHYKFSSEQIEEAVAKHREYYSTKGIYENKTFEGIKELLSALKERGKTLVLATTKPEIFAENILKHFDLYKYFTLVAGVLFDGSRSDKAVLIEYALNTLKITNPATSVMVGDRKYDILGAKANGMECIGVLYGYGEKEELETAGATVIAETVGELKDYLIQN
ncbi:MAG: HAD family hydrolase [Firmicutes bacterium]|nr:HAD family hydrolase [Bacillota bacterium]